jgi:hypothetical protein
MNALQQMQARRAEAMAASRQAQAAEMFSEIAAHIEPAHSGNSFSVGFVREAYAHLVQAGHAPELAAYETLPTLTEVKSGIERAFQVSL